MRVRPTELGMKGLLLLAALEVAFFATTYSNLFFLVWVFSAVLGCFGLVSGVTNVRGLRIQSIDVPAAPANVTRLVRADLRTRRRRFDVMLVLDDGARRVALPHVPLLTGSGVVALELMPLPRGLRSIRAVRVTTHFPFGLFEVSRSIPFALDVITYPERGVRRHAAGHADGEEESSSGAAASAHANVAGLRPFRSGDAVRDMHWKATARRGEPIVREREPSQGEMIEVVVDRRVAEPELERTLAAATALVFAAKDTDRPVRLASQGYEVELAAGQAPPLAVLRWLAAAATLPATAEAPHVRAGVMMAPQIAGESRHA
jgi:uncharacterized protein (DUF58 family)